MSQDIKDRLNIAAANDDQEWLNETVLQALWDLTGRIEALEDRAKDEVEIDIGCNAGHPIFTAEDEKHLEMMERADQIIEKAELEELEIGLITATLDYVDSYKDFNKVENTTSTTKLREWGQKNYLLHRTMIEAAEKLKAYEND